jgi:hypothetical protein
VQLKQVAKPRVCDETLREQKDNTHGQIVMDGSIDGELLGSAETDGLLLG